MRLGLRQPRAGGSGVAGIGFILSPVSWWNDALVNIPLALGAARAVSHLTGVDVRILFGLFYWATNIAGIILMAAGSGYSLGGALSRRSIAIGILASIAYTLAVLIILG